MLLNEYIHWWYVLVALLLLVPTIVAASLLTAFFNNDTHDRRSSLRCACILVIISFSLLAIWNIFYFQFWYKNADVMFGQPEIGYIKQTKKQFVFWSIFLSLTIDGFYAYFICVVSHYKNALAPKEEKKAAKPVAAAPAPVAPAPAPASKPVSKPVSAAGSQNGANAEDQA